MKALQPLTDVNKIVDSSPACQIPAVARCCESWQRAWDAEIKVNKHEHFAGLAAGVAYRKVLPPLSDTESIRDFVACVAQGLLLQAIEEKAVGKLIYAAQVALSAASRHPKTKTPDAADNPSPSPSLFLAK
jgi:hypothetical protein